MEGSFLRMDTQEKIKQFAGDLDRYALAYGKLADALWSEQNPDSAPLERRPYGQLRNVAN